jgi:hypothetical protein
VPPGARALVLGRVSSFGDVIGNCFLSASSIGEIPNTLQRTIGPGEVNTLVGVTPPLPAGATAFGINCNEFSNSDGLFNQVSASAVLISSN